MPDLLMGNTLFGGSSNSKLFLNVREKLSLCYYASSLYHRQSRHIAAAAGKAHEMCIRDRDCKCRSPR